MIPQDSITAFRKEILDWYSQHKRDLPWRKSRDPYAITVSEIMLQQTQVGRVIPKFIAWMQTFPTVIHLAQAPVSEVLLLWSGLGYNRRALFLQRSAIEIVTTYRGYFPSDEKTLRLLPGIGQYTSRAILCFAFNKQIAVVDTNVKKVIVTHWKLKKYTDREIDAIAQQLLPHGLAYEWNQALMDYSALQLKGEKIPIPKQSRFKDSDRFFRGAIVSYMLSHTWVTLEQLLAYFFTAKHSIRLEKLEKLLHELEKEGFLQYSEAEKAYRIP